MPQKSLSPTRIAGAPNTPAAMAASCGFMLPVGTPPNAIVYGTGRVTMRDMMRAGFAADLLAVGVITVVATLVLPYIAR